MEYYNSYKIMKYNRLQEGQEEGNKQDMCNVQIMRFYKRSKGHYQQSTNSMVFSYKVNRMKLVRQCK